MGDISTIYKLSLILYTILRASGTNCPVLECWFVQEKPGGGFPAATSQEKSLLYISSDTADRTEAQSTRRPPADISPSRIYHISDPSATLCRSALHPPQGSVKKPQCEINPFLPQPAMIQWAAALTSAALSPVYLQADWFSVALQGLDGQLVLSNVMRATSATNEPNVILSVFSKTASVRSRLGVPVSLDCGFWADPSSPLSGSGFTVEWRYQYRGEGRLVLAYDGKTDRYAESSEKGAELDFTALHQTRNASLLLEETQVRHSGTYICTIYLPYLLAQVTLDLEIQEPPSISISPSPLPVIIPGQSVSVQCDASGFAPLSLQLRWEFVGVDGKVQVLGEGRMSGHRQASDGTFSQNSWLDLDTSRLNLGRGGELACVAVHSGGTRRVSATVNIVGVSAPSIEDSMAMVAVALGLYGLIKVFSWTFGSFGSGNGDSEDKKQN
ncbi:TAP binding protein (tapasin), tandem duplicate 1 [Brienomyrus brachyistius]|uniref:TAP binding protein (tapasin), tandem duplicate 1 n=1 Tax=Brienomyrus brachyistius TaxID=42636 RepID=UPI0020B31E97|nr:TAP binding protein (tapasin), tandem duplicate 1 [Brienomyrus brachyistius]